MWKTNLSLVYRVRYWRARREAEPLMAQALYEPLTPQEAARRDFLFAAYPELAKEFDTIRRVSNRINLEEDGWSGDLLPGLVQKINQIEHSRRMRRSYAGIRRHGSVCRLFVWRVYARGRD